MRGRLASAAAVSLLVAVPCASAVQAQGTPRVTLVGDSVAASLDLVPSARASLARGLALRVDARVCRRLVQPSCAFHGATPTTALETVRALGAGTGGALVVDVGYNEGPAGYGSGIDRVMRAARGAGVRGVVWVTLRETTPLYGATNRAIRAAERRWPRLQVADWNAHSAGRPWFRADGLHLNASGAEALARFLRPFAVRAAAG